MGDRGFLWESHTTEDILFREGDLTPHLPPELHYTPCQKAWLALSRQIGFFCPKLEGLGIGHHLLLLHFSDVSAGKLTVRWQQETLPTDAWQCRWGLMVILNMVPFADLLWEFERGPHLLCQFFMVIHSRNLSQFLPPVRHVMCPGSPGHPTLSILHRGFWGGHPPILSPPSF